MGGYGEGGATLFSGRHNDSTRGNRLKLEHGKISLDTGRKPRSCKRGQRVEEFVRRRCEISVSEAIQNTTGQFPEPPDLTGFCFQQKVGLRDPPEVPGQRVSP